MTDTITTIGGIRHPFWRAKIADWTKWRLIYDGGPQFVEQYLEHYSNREDSADFIKRKKITPTPNFAKAAVNDIKNSIFQRLTDVSRTGGDEQYQKAVQGEGFGVDQHGSSMNSYIGQEILPELLTMAKIGVFVDMPALNGRTKRDVKNKRPYLYAYRTEDILSWTYRPGQPDEFDNLLLRDYVEVSHGRTGLPAGVKERFRFVFIGDDDKVHIRFYENMPASHNPKESKEMQVDASGNPTNQDVILELQQIPFAMAEISDSLLADTANHQIALLNMESSDVAYSLLSNFPFYTEMQDDKDFSHFFEGAGQGDDDGTAAKAEKGKDQEVQVGAVHGRRYRKGLDRPGYIHPSPEPLRVSMEKQQQLKDDIRQLVNLALSNIKPKMASAESKAIDERGLEAGLSYIGLVLEHFERKVARYWANYLGTTPATIKYPERYSLKSDEDRRKDVEQLAEKRSTIPSKTFQTIITQQMADILIGHKTPASVMEKINQEIEEAQANSAVPETIFEAVDRGILDLELAATLLGYPESTVEKAAEQHAARLKRISDAQSKPDSQNQDPAARGVGDFDSDPGTGSQDEKAASRDRTQQADTRDRTRGEARGTPE